MPSVKFNRGPVLPQVTRDYLEHGAAALGVVRVSQGSDHKRIAFGLCGDGRDRREIDSSAAAVIANRIDRDPHVVLLNYVRNESALLPQLANGANVDAGKERQLVLGDKVAFPFDCGQIITEPFECRGETHGFNYRKAVSSFALVKVR